MSGFTVHYLDFCLANLRVRNRGLRFEMKLEGFIQVFKRFFNGCAPAGNFNTQHLRHKPFVFLANADVKLFFMSGAFPPARVILDLRNRRLFPVSR